MTVEGAIAENAHILSRSGIWRLAKITSGSLMFMLLKLGLVALIHHLSGIPAWLNYGIVTVSVSAFGWIYHSRVSFQLPLSRQTLSRYAQQAVALKMLDYALYNVVVYVIGLDLRVAVVMTSGVVFVTRVTVYIKYVFVQSSETEQMQKPAPGVWSD